MPRFPELPSDEYASIYLEDTDRALPEKLNQNTRYTHFKTIARGGKSIIQSCRDRYLARVICYKKLKPEFRKDAIEQQRFLREARVTAALQHPSIVPTYELGRERDGNLYFTMKLVQGLTMRELFDEKYRDRYDLVQLVEVLERVIHALRYAHSHRVIHRDIKPDNVLVGPYDEVLLMDWGLAKVWHEDGTPDDLSHEGAVVGDAPVTTITGAGNLEGTIAYMSPEQLRKDPDIDYRTDIYSIGVLLYEMLARQTPFQGKTIEQMTRQILETEPPKPSRLTSLRVPGWLEELALECMAKDPDARVPSCGELLRRIRDGWESEA
jgi:serine/threonine-protein kinase